MNDFILTAIFRSENDAALALEALRDHMLDESQLRRSADCVIHVGVTSAAAERIMLLLRQRGALDVSAATREADPGWMSHQHGHVTGSQVMPGEGDSEAGTSTANVRTDMR